MFSSMLADAGGELGSSMSSPSPASEGSVNRFALGVAESERLSDCCDAKEMLRECCLVTRVMRGLDDIASVEPPERRFRLGLP